MTRLVMDTIDQIKSVVRMLLQVAKGTISTSLSESFPVTGRVPTGPTSVLSEDQGASPERGLKEQEETKKETEETEEKGPDPGRGRGPTHCSGRERRHRRDRRRG